MATMHSVLGASSAARWIACPGSIRLSKGIPRVSSVYADEGTAAHHVAEMCLIKKINAAEFPEKSVRVNGKDYPVTEEMIDAVQLYLDTLRADLYALSLTEDVGLEIEKKFNLDHFYDGLWGTCDAVIRQPFGCVRVYDLKYGAGVAVDAEDNAQAMYYALGAIGIDSELYDDIELVIVQPRAHHGDGPVRRCKMTVGELLKWAIEVLLPAAKATEDPEAPLCTGEHCRFCPALAVCPAQQAQALTVAKEVFAAVPKAPPAPETLTIKDLKKILDVAPMVEAWIDACRSYVHTLLETGATTSDEVGYKLVNGKSSRSWKDEKEAEEFLSVVMGEAAYIPKKLVSPAQAEKVLKGAENKRALEGLIEKTPGKPQLAPLSDKREAIVPAIAAFTEFSEGEIEL